MIDPKPYRKYTFLVDGRDVVAALGAACVVVGACAFHWALGLMAVGAGLCGLAWRLSREP